MGQADGVKILVVDDDFVSRNVMVSAVEKLGHECLVAEGGLEGWQLFQKEPCEVVLSDWLMPELSGLELCRLVREFQSEDYCYVIMLSSLDKKHHVLEGLKAGADDYLTKPLDFEELQGRLLSAQRVTSLHRNLLKAQSQAVLNSKLAAVGQLAAGVAHQLNTPLGAVKLALDSALRRLDNTEQVEAKLKLSLQAIGNMQGIVSQLLDSSRMAPGKSSHCELSGLTQETLGLLRVQLQVDQVDLVSQLQEGLEVAIPASEMQQIVINLVTNARDAVLENGSLGTRIEVETEKRDGCAVLRVRDQGPGIPEERLGRLFEPFFTTKPSGSGVGLGLPIVKNLVELHQGSVEVTSPSKGETTFEVCLPLSAGH